MPCLRLASARVLALLLLAACGGGGEVCDDLADNDGDGFTDCADQDCFAVCDEDCGNGVDDDGDTLVDCDDPDCAGACLEVCDDGVDNDGDGHVDCTDPDCVGTGHALGARACIEDCTNGVDDDGDYLVDCADTLDCREVCDADGDGYTAAALGGPDCDDANADVHPGATEVPYDGRDDDCDPLTPDDDLDGDGFPLADDCDDTSALVFPGAPEVCGDGVVDDCDATAVPARSDCYGDRSLATADARLDGTTSDDYTGFSVAGVGDVNQDGYDDVLVGAYGEGSNSKGAVYLVHGPVTGALDLSLAAAKLLGESEDDWAGWSVAAAGDPNGNGVPDLLVGAHYDDATGSSAGAAYLIRGNVTGQVDLDQADTKILGASEFDLAGYAVAGAGDVNGDGLDDLLVGAIQNERAGFHAGAAYVVHGGVQGLVLLDFAPITLLGMGTNHHAGCALDGGADADGDGLADVVVGACDADRPGAPDAGAAYLHTGLVDGTFQLASGAGAMVGQAAGDHAGAAVAFAGDVDGDGLADFLVGAPGSDEAALDAGAAYLYAGPGDTMPIPAAELLGEAEADAAGGSVDGAGDVNDDGFADLVIGGAGSDLGGEDAGAAWIVFGPVSGVVDLSAAPIRLLGSQPFDYAGQAVAGAGDTNGDGLADVLVGAPFVDTSVPSAGAAYLITFGY